MNASETISYLLGSWRVRRALVDQRSGETSSFEGVATFSLNPAPTGDAVRFEEIGEMAVGPYRGEASRRLDYRAKDERTLLVAFCDGRHFIDLDLARGHSSDVHRCGADRYEITTIARSPELLEERWRVRGPRKDYVALTTFQRLAEE